MLRSLSRLIKLCENRISVREERFLPIVSIQKCDFVDWTRENFPDIITFRFKHDGRDILIYGLNGYAKTIFLFRHVPSIPFPISNYLHITKKNNTIGLISHIYISPPNSF